MNENGAPPTEPRPAPPIDPAPSADTGPEPNPPAALLKVVGRRKALALLAAGGAAALVAATRRGGGEKSTLSADANSATSTAAGSNSSAGSGAATPTSATPAPAGATTGQAATGGSAGTAIATVSAPGRIPEETAGPYPGDGTNGPNVLSQSGVVRSDIRRSFASGSAAADGVPLTIELTLVGADSGKALPGATIYLWHCDRLGRYSLYSSGLGNENYLRGVQVADAKGVLRFTSIFPGAYSGRWPHIHFHVFDSQSQATSGRNAQVTSQLALPESICRQVYATSGYESSARNLSQSSLGSDMVFRDGTDHQLATVTGSSGAGYTARLVVGV